MKIEVVFLVCGIFCSAAFAVPKSGTSVSDFFGRHVDCTIPALSGIPAKMAAGDTNAANRIFADYVRVTLDSRKVNAAWYKGRLTAKGREKLRMSAEAIMDYRLSACGVPHHFNDHKIDWTFNPTYNGYREWPWQLGRQKFFTTLAEYYVKLGHDERAAATWRDMVSGWMPISPPGPHEHRPIPTPVLKGRFTGARRIVSVFYPYRDNANRIAGVKASPNVDVNVFSLLLVDGSKLELGECIGQDVK